MGKENKPSKIHDKSLLSGFHSKEKLIDFLAEKRIYPFISKNGKLFLRHNKDVYFTEEQTEKIFSVLGIKTDEYCKSVRETLKERSAKLNPHVPVKNWVVEERPRELLVKNGSENLSLSKLLAIILRTGREGESAEELARYILNKFKTLRNIDSATIKELCEVEGIGIAKSSQIKAALELGKRLMQEEAKLVKNLKSPREVAQYVYEYFSPYLRDSKKEFFIVVLLDIKNKPIKHVEISMGSINASIVDPKEIIKEATLNSASAVILVHNHPSGETEPSAEDVKLTEQIVNACELVNVKVVDHIILGKNHDDFFSFANAGLIK